MIRKLTLAALLTTALALPAVAQDKINPATGPTGVISKEVPTMKSDSAAPNTTAPDKSMGAATPTMKPADTVNGAAASPTSVKLSEAEVKAWYGKPVYSSDGKNIGEVEAFKLSADGTVTELHAGIGGFLGMGETHVVLLPSQFTLAGDRVNISVASTDAKALPKLMK